VADDWPASPYAPKALLAVGQLDPSEAEAALVRLDSLYPDSPYLALIRGQDAPGYRELEDSLAAFAGKQVVRARPTYRANPRRPLEPADDEPGDRPRKRRPAEEPGKRRSPDQ
jgi:hypothetical protein